MHVLFWLLVSRNDDVTHLFIFLAVVKEQNGALSPPAGRFGMEKVSRLQLQAATTKPTFRYQWAVSDLSQGKVLQQSVIVLADKG